MWWEKNKKPYKRLQCRGFGKNWGETGNGKKIQRFHKYYLWRPESFTLRTIKKIISFWRSWGTSFVSQIIFNWKLFLRTVDSQVRTTCEFTFLWAMKKSKRQKLFIYSHLSPICYLVLYLGHIKPDPCAKAYINAYAGLICHHIFLVAVCLPA